MHNIINILCKIKFEIENRTNTSDVSSVQRKIDILKYLQLHLQLIIIIFLIFLIGNLCKLNYCLIKISSESKSVCYIIYTYSIRFYLLCHNSFIFVFIC
jgi:hypothetical protein